MQSILMAFVILMVIFQLIPEFVDANTLIQADTDASALTKLAGNLAEWGLPVGATIAVITSIIRGNKGG